MSPEQLDTDKIFNDFISEVKNIRALCLYQAKKMPSPYFRPIPDPSKEVDRDDPYPSDFYYFCNFISIPRQVEIARYSYFANIVDVLAKLLAAIHEKSVTDTALHFRYFIEVTAAFVVRADKIFNLCESFLEIPVEKRDAQKQEFLNEVGKTIHDLNKLIFPTSVDWQKAVDTTKGDDGIQADKRPFPIGKLLKKMQKKAPTQIKIYDFCSEIIHPNAWPSMVAGEGAGLMSAEGKPIGRVTIFHTDRQTRYKKYFDSFFLLLAGSASIEYFKDLGLSLKESLNLLEQAEIKTLKMLRPVGRKHLNISLNHLDLDCFEDQLLCPCGSNKTYKKCCGHPRK